MKQAYTAPEFDVSLYDVDDVITLSVGTGAIEGGETGKESGWMDI